MIFRVRVTIVSNDRKMQGGCTTGGREGGLGELLRERGHVNAYVIG